MWEEQRDTPTRSGLPSPRSPGSVHEGARRGQAGDVLPDMHQVLVHAPRVLGGDWDGDSVLLQVRGQDSTGKTVLARGSLKATSIRPACLGFLSKSKTPPNSGSQANKTLDPPPHPQSPSPSSLASRDPRGVFYVQR